MMTMTGCQRRPVRFSADVTATTSAVGAAVGPHEVRVIAPDHQVVVVSGAS